MEHDFFGSLQGNICSPVFREGIFQTRVFTLYTISHSRFFQAMNDPSSMQTDIRMWKKIIRYFLEKN